MGQFNLVFPWYGRQSNCAIGCRETAGINHGTAHHPEAAILDAQISSIEYCSRLSRIKN